MTNPHADRDLHRRVDALCRELIEKDPDITTKELHERCARKFGHLHDLSRRQFHARHPLQVKRAMAQESEARAAEEEMEEKVEASTPSTSNEDEKPDWATPPGGGETREPAQREMFAREDGGA